MNIMSAKDFVIDFVKNLSDNLSIEEILYRIVFEKNLALAEEDIKMNRVYSQKEAKEKMKKNIG
jgi:hypothetical protein